MEILITIKTINKKKMDKWKIAELMSTVIKRLILDQLI